MNLIAHSGNNEVAPQLYSTHVLDGSKKAREIMEELRGYLSFDDFQKLQALVLGSFEVHDMGKLCINSQKVLKGDSSVPAGGKMPNHVDAGVAYLLNLKRPLEAWIVKSHHWGYGDLPYFPRFDEKYYEKLRDDKLIRERCQWMDWIDHKEKMCEYTDRNLDYLSKKQKECVPDFEKFEKPTNANGLFMRFALSILVSADHFDTAKNYKNYVVEKTIPLRAKERLEKLDEYVKGLSERKYNSIRNEVYNACRNSLAKERMVFCKSEVGSGKTTAIMAYALQKAIELNLRRVIYVAPFTNIISQTVNVYRNALVLPDEDEDEYETIAEHHHQVDYLSEIEEKSSLEDEEYLFSRKRITQDWHSPVICTTAVQFFETLASVKTGKLKKLHQLAGSVIIIDEQHCCIPTALWPLTLIWLKELTEKWGCIVVFASGSMVLPWKNETIIKLVKQKFYVPSIISEELSLKTLDNEKKRISLKYISKPHNLYSICNWICQNEFYGPKVCVFNTIQNAAVVANTLAQIKGKDYVIHLSTCLTPIDREKILEKIKQKLNNQEDFILIATSCVECGLDISFKHGFRENSKLECIMQLRGRTSRNNEFFENCSLNVFELEYTENGCFTEHPDFKHSSKIFRDLYSEYGENLGPEHCEESFNREIQSEGFKNHVSRREEDKELTTKELIKKEEHLKLETVRDHYNVINASKTTVIIHEDLLPENCSTTELIRNSVQIYDSKLEKKLKNLVEVSEKFDGYLKWKGKYNDFLGYFQELL